MNLHRLAFLALLTATPLLAQHEEHAATAPAAAAEDPHAGHTTPAEPAPAASDPHAGHTETSDTAITEEAAAPAHDMEAMIEAAAVPEAAPPPEAFSGPAHAADTIFNPA